MSARPSPAAAAPCICARLFSLIFMTPFLSCAPPSGPTAQTPLAACVRLPGSGAMVQYLVQDAGADPLAADAAGTPPYVLALSLGRLDLVPLFLRHCKWVHRGCTGDGCVWGVQRERRAMLQCCCVQELGLGRIVLSSHFVPAVVGGGWF